MLPCTVIPGEVSVVATAISMSHAGTPCHGNIAEYVDEVTFVNALGEL